MNKSIKYLLISSLFSFIAARLPAQTLAGGPGAAAGAADTIPGRFFNLDRYNSTGAVSTVSGDLLYHTPAASLTNTLYGRLPGLTVTQQSGEPGNDNASMGIRGIGTYALGNNGYSAYKIFVDGFEVNANYFNYIAPAEIESVSILKDAAALATLGMRGSNGVIWVITRRGVVGKSTITFQARSGFQSPTVINKPLNAYGYASMYNEAASNDNGNIWTPKYSPAQLSAYQHGTGTNVDWYKQTVRNNTPYTDGDLVFNGGDSITRYNVVFDYASQQGLFKVKNTDSTSNEMLNRYNLRTNLNFRILSIFEARVDLGARLEDRKQPNYNANQIFTDLANYPSNIYPARAGTGYSGTTLYPNNPVGSVNGLGWSSTHTKIIQGNFGLKEKLDFVTPGLYLDEAFSVNSYSLSSYNKTATYARYLNGATTTPDKTTPIIASGLGAQSQQDWKQISLKLGYDRHFGNSHFNSAVNYYQSDYRGEGLFGYEYHYQNISGRANYSYKNRYVGEFGFSYFGSDAYAPGNRWGFYPALSGAWNVSNEDFLQGSHVINFLKIRASAGKTGGADSQAGSSGNFTAFQSNGRYFYQQYYTGSGTFYTGDGTPTGASTLNPLFTPNARIFAEQSIKYNLGADLTLFRALNLTLDAFMDRRTGIVTLDNSIPGDFGNNIQFNNVGRMTNKGFEAAGVWAGKSGAVTYSLNAMASYSKNKIDYEAEVPAAYPYNARTGRPYGTQIGLVATGLYQLSDFNADGSLRPGQAAPSFGKVQPGDIRYKDLNRDGKIDQTDVTSIGKPMFPSLTYAFGTNFGYKGFDLGVFFQGVSGTSVNLLTAPGTIDLLNNGNAFTNARNAWAYYPAQGIDTRANATYPRLTATGNNNNYQQSSYWMKSGDFLRIRNAEIGYTFSAAVLNSVRLSKLRVYVNAVNPVTWSTLMKNYHLDPENINGYPTLKSVNLGLIATF